ncbi:MAG: ferrous iron transport protein B [Candidatus Sericytochromatia bacterium]
MSLNTPSAPVAQPTEARERKLVLAGNPNVGKSVFFNFLTGLYVDVSNYPGTTIDISRGKADGYLIMDTPGVYGVASFNDEERVARDIILGADVILNVVSASTLERDLFLTQQLIDMGKPIVVAVNQMDDARAHGLVIDVPKLSALLGVPVYPCVATTREGLDAVRQAIAQAHPGNRLPGLEAFLPTQPGLDPAEALMIAEGDLAVAERLAMKPGHHRDDIYARRRDRVNDLIDAVLTENTASARFSVTLGRWLLNPIFGTLTAFAMMAALYYLIGDLVAQQLVGITEGEIMAKYYEPWARGVISAVIPAGPLHEILAGEFGVVTMTITYVLGLLFPLVVGFYLFLSVMEDTGYLPRLAVLVDRALSMLGLNGRAVIPLIIGFGCVTMATITTRLLGTQREKTIATAILGLTIPCSAQLGVILGLLAKTGGWQYWAIYSATMFAVLVAVGTLMNKLLPGQSSPLLIDLPPLRLPQWKNVARKTWSKSWGFLVEATPLFALGALIVGVMKVTGLLQVSINGLAPAVVGLLHLPKEAATAFIMGLIRRDFGAAGLTDLPLSPAQMVVALVVITLFVPCIATVTVLFKERGWREALTLWLGSWVLAFAIGGVLAAGLIR